MLAADHLKVMLKQYGDLVYFTASEGESGRFGPKALITSQASHCKTSLASKTLLIAYLE